MGKLVAKHFYKEWEENTLLFDSNSIRNCGNAENMSGTVFKANGVKNNIQNEEHLLFIMFSIYVSIKSKKIN